MLIYHSSLDAEVPESLVGGKAYNLNLLTKAGFNVPKWFVITSNAFQSMNNDLKQKIENTLNELNLRGKLLAVRSSAIGEDGVELSFAGQMESFLYVKHDNLFHSIEKVWKSAFSDRIKFYREQNNISHIPVKVAVIVQEMIDPDSSGVGFGIDPITGDRKTITICSVKGVGEGLVSGEVDSDNFKIKGNNITSKIIYNSLNNQQVKLIAEEINKINYYYKRPQDVEWAISGNRLYILQSRPVTTLNKTPDKTQTQIIWDNSNIIESYSGITTPLTFSFIQNVYTEVYKQFCRIMGVEEELIEKNNDVFQMLGLIKGRVYYNLLSWYKVLALLPGYSLNAGFMEQMMGVEQKLETRPEVVKSDKNDYLRILNLVSKLIFNLIALPEEIKKFYRLLDKTLTPYENIDLNKKTPHKLMNIYFELERKLLKKWDAPLVNDFYAMIFYGVLKKLLTKWNIDDKGTLQNDLLAGDGEIISTEPITRIRQMANNIDSPEFEKAFNDYIKKFGNRCIGELKLETITYKQDSSLLMSIIRSYAKQGYHDIEKDKQKEREIRKKSEMRVKKELGFNILKQGLFSIVLDQARLRVRNRENLRFERTRLFGLIREIFLGIGRSFYSEGIISDERDIFYLTKEEIFSYINGTSASSDLKKLIKMRKDELEGFESEKVADRFTTYGTVYHANSFKRESEKIHLEGDLKGIGCCPGIVRAKVKIVRNPSEVEGLEGCIMVAERTDPGWVPLFPISKAILVERGSILSHSAIVSREMGIPAIVGVTGLLDTLIDGEEVEMDGSTGVIKRLGENNA